MAIKGTIPKSDMVGAREYSTQSPVSLDVPGFSVPPAVLQTLMVGAPKPVSPPPHPQVTAQLSAIPLGYQFAFNQLVSPTPYNNIITAYRIYRNKMANSFSGAQLIRTITHDSTHQGAVTVQDSTGGNVNYFYFVTAVDSTGQESNQPGAFQASPVTSGTVSNIAIATPTTNSPSTTSGTYSVIAEMTITLTTHGNKVLVLFNGSFADTSGVNSARAAIAVFKDGSQLTTDYIFDLLPTGGPTGVVDVISSMSVVDNPTAASHTYDVRFKLLNGTGGVSAVNLARSLQVVEIG
jgi:hypothetical protein